MAHDIEQKKFRVEKVVYYNSSSHWGVLGLTPVDKLGSLETELLNAFGSITANGNFEKPFDNAEVLISGNVVVNPQYGKQIAIKQLQILKDTSSKEGIINYLARGEIAGIGIQLAEKIYDTFGDDSIDIVLNSTDRLKEVYGIGKKTVEKVKSSVDFLKAHEFTIKYLTGIGVSYSTILKLLEEFGEETVDIVSKDPYSILEVSKELSFKQVDDIFLKAGGDPNSPLRLETAFLYILKQQAMMEGSTGCVSSTLSRKFYSLLDLSGAENYFVKTATALEGKGKIVLGAGAIDGWMGGHIYYKEYLDIEKDIAEKIKGLISCNMPNKKIKGGIVEEEIKNFPFTLNKQQIKAVKSCLENNVAVLTGQGGSGKSSITKALYRIYKRCEFNVVLLSPTAKACRRLEECTGGKAQTIHKFLKMTKDGYCAECKDYTKNTVLIIDEASMMDIILFKELLKRSTMSTRVLLVGDNNQLPSVQAGNVLGDTIDSKVVHTAVLTDIMRQQENSNIIKYCSMINKGEIFSPCEHNDFLYEEFGSADELKEKFLPLYKKEVEEVGLNEVQVIAPYKKGELGMNNLNVILQAEINPKGKKALENFRIGDKVRHTQNNYNKDVFNGETGVIISFDSEEDEMKVDFGDRNVTYDHLDVKELVLSYASTVHASQGSEYKVVFVILDDTSVNNFLHIRRLLYTAVSRGKSKVYILTKPYLVDTCIGNDTYRPRITMLKDFLQEV